MKAQDIIAALALPPDARVDQRVPKKLFLEQGAPTAADKRAIQDGIEEVMWVAALKPTNCGVPTFKNDAREYLEIAVLIASFRVPAKVTRLVELIHRAIPYPLLLVAEHAGSVGLSVAHKRASQAEAIAVVLDGAVIEVSMGSESPENQAAFVDSLRLADQPNSDLQALYTGWIERLQAVAASRLTGQYMLTQTMAEAVARQKALDDYARITREIAGMRAKAAKEKQINRRVDINLAIQRLEDELHVATKKL
ncbi:DUF4391 domain-containing protein [uncultured Bradyrhizobium sp.]|uniref:DUF4391 domain-containing protein n=1 Tax=uncultured Bradyrhizobium sp. TaxID=199684 RepID=UPI0035CAC1EA